VQEPLSSAPTPLSRPKVGSCFSHCFQVSTKIRTRKWEGGDRWYRGQGGAGLDLNTMGTVKASYMVGSRGVVR
jgi:hypothetical protein